MADLKAFAEQLVNLTVKEVNELADILKEEYGIEPAAAAVAVAAGPAGYPETGSILAQASFPNPEEILRPGQFAKVKAKVRVVKNGILIPQRCVMELQGLHNVFVVDANNKVEKREVKVGPRIKAFWLITEGLKPGEQVVYEGLQKVKPGATVKPTMKKATSTGNEQK